MKGSSENDDQTKQRQELYIENPAYDKGPGSILPIQTANSLATNPTPASTSGFVASPDTGAHACADVDSKEEEENAGAGGYAQPRRVIFSKTPPDDKVPSYKEEITIVDKDDYSNDEIESHAFDNTRLGSKTRETAADVEGYSHIVINSREEELQDPEDDKLITHDACDNPLRSKKTVSIKGTSARSDDYDHITINPKATEGHPQRAKLQRQDDDNNPLTNKNAVGKATGKAALADDQSYIDVNSGVGEEMRREVQASAGEANIPEVDPSNKIQTSIQNDETEVVYDNASEKTAEECDDEFNRLKFSQLDSKKTAEECDDEFNRLKFSQVESKKTAEECDDEFNRLKCSQLDSKKTAEECDDEFNRLKCSQLDSKKTAEECDDEFNRLNFSQLDSRKTAEECDDEFNRLKFSQLDSKKTAEECDDEFNRLKFSQLDSKKTAEECDDEFNRLKFSQLDSKKTAEECDDEFNRLKFSQQDSKTTEDPEHSHIFQV